MFVCSCGFWGKGGREDSWFMIHGRCEMRVKGCMYVCMYVCVCVRIDEQQ